MNFTELPLSEQVLKGVEAAGFSECTKVQAKVLPISLTHRDVMVQSKTGSGKTAIYALTILEAFVQAKQQGKATPKALVIAPTRELAVQIEMDTLELAKGIEGLVIGCFYGGVGYAKQDELIEKGCDIFVATPGRILDYQKMHKIDFRQFDIFVVDEADRLFDMGFYPDIQRMFSLLRPQSERQTMLFSATLGTKVRNLAWSFMNEPVEIEVEPEQIVVNLVSQELYHISKAEKFGLLLYLLNENKPENCLIFANTKARCIEVAKRLSLNGYQARYLMGDMIQSKRLQTIDRMKEGQLEYLVATDVAARGLQIDDLEMVVNYDLPDDYESYVHRIGRTARAGKSGKSISLADEEYVFNLEAIETYIQMKIPVVWPDPDEVAKVEDKSASKSFRDLVGRNEYTYSSDRRRDSRRPSSGGRRPAGQQGRARARGGKAGLRPQPKGQQPRRRDGERRPPRTAGSKSYAQIQSLSLDERLAYYKEQYRQESGIEAPRSQSDRQGSPKRGTQASPAREDRKTPPKGKQAPRVRGGQSTSRPARDRGGNQRPAESAQQPKKPAEQPRTEAVKQQPKKKQSFLGRLLGRGKQ
jgi:ATP-dependent RNA helicase RhlB